jgi:peptidoglycan/xylan/chitin deacetylase (PgdA/CDA1 family)
LSDDKLQDELEGSKKELEEITGRKVDLLAYPLGGYDDKVKEFCRKAGYRACFATSPGIGQKNGDIYAIKRIKVSSSSDNPIIFWIKLSGWYTWIKEHRDE